MEELFYFLMRVCLGSSLLYAIYFFVLRKTTFFNLNRVFLVSAVIVPVLLSLFPLHYTVIIQPSTAQNLTDWTTIFKQAPADPEMIEASSTSQFNWPVIVLAIYITGILLFSLRLLIQSLKPIQIILKNKNKQEGQYRIHENRYFSLPFSFFNHIFIHPDYHKQEDLEAIIAHEEVHIRERHWIDLLVIEVFTLVFWFNPFSWLLEHAIKQNHEYLADSGVLSRGQSPARYQLLLVNQLMGMQVLGFTNNLNFALGPTRLKMMKKQKTPKKKLIRLAFTIPVVAILLVAFAQPEYQNVNPATENALNSNINNSLDTDKEVTVTGVVVDDKGEAMPGASIIIQGTSIGTVSDMQGHFKLSVPTGKEVTLFASFVGYETFSFKPDFQKDEKILDFEICMKRAVITISSDFSEEMPPPPPPPAPATGESANSNDEVFFIVEDMPHYPMGHYGLGKYIDSKKNELKEKNFFDGKKLSGKATVGFTVNGKGEVTNVQVLEKTTDEAAKALTTIIKGMDKWTPGAQRGKNVPVDFAITLNF